MCRTVGICIHLLPGPVLEEGWDPHKPKNQSYGHMSPGYLLYRKKVAIVWIGEGGIKMKYLCVKKRVNDWASEHAVYRKFSPWDMSMKARSQQV